MKKIFSIILLIGCLMSVGYFMREINNPRTNILHSEILITPVVAKKTATPIKLIIPKINVQANIESVSTDSEGRMDIPKGVDNVAWYNLGNKPGEKGNAVIDGHFDKASGAPGVFYSLNKLAQGDKIIIVDASGQKYSFSVVRTQKYADNNFPLKEVFGSSDKAMLNLITCQGIWNTTTKNYSKRLVVYSELMN